MDALGKMKLKKTKCKKNENMVIIIRTKTHFKKFDKKKLFLQEETKKTQ
jgi:hypothetical protein